MRRGRLLSFFSVPTAARDERMATMEGLRAYAALIVFFVHYTSMALRELTPYSLEQAEGPAGLFLWWINRSHYGVDIFFLISGYLISGLVLRPDYRPFRYGAHRVFRIYPALVVLLVVATCYFVFLDGQSFWPMKFAGNLLLLNGVPGLDFPPIILPTWSIFFEFAFYVSFPLLCALAGRGASPRRKLMVATAAALVIITALSLALHDTYARFAMFFAGAWLRRWHDEGVAVRLPAGMVLVIYLAASATWMAIEDWRLFTIVYIVPATLFVGHVLAASSWLSRIFAIPLLRAFGNISYSFYLYHTLSLGIAIRLAGLAGLAFWPAAVFALVVGFGLACLFAALSFWAVERPYFVWKGRFDRWLDGRAAPMAT